MMILPFACQIDPAKREALRDALRSLLQRHHAFADAWAMSEGELAPLDAIVVGLEAISPAEQHRWLFRANHDLVVRPNASFEDLQAELDVKHRWAADELLKSLSIDELFAFAQTVTLRCELGRAIAKAEAGDDIKGAILKRSLLADEAEADLGFGVLYALAFTRGAAWLNGLWGRRSRRLGVSAPNSVDAGLFGFHLPSIVPHALVAQPDASQGPRSRHSKFVEDGTG